MYTDERQAAEISFYRTFPIPFGGLELLDLLLDQVEESANQRIKISQSRRP